MKAFLAVGAITFVASKFIFDTTAEKAIVAAVVVGGLAEYLASMNPGSLPAPTPVSQAGTGTPAPPSTVPDAIVASAPSGADVAPGPSMNQPGS